MKFSNLSNGEHFLHVGKYYSKQSGRTAKSEKGIEAYFNPETEVQRVGFGNERSQSPALISMLKRHKNSNVTYERTYGLIASMERIGWTCEAGMDGKVYGLKRTALL